MRYLSLILIRPFLRIKYIGKENITKNGKLIICSNHISLLDPVIIAMGVRRHIFFMAKSEFFTDKGFFVKYFMKLVGAFPVKRSTADLHSVSDAASLLNQNKQVGIFPQGRIVNDNTSFELKAGAALLAVKTNAPIIPVSIYCENKIRPFSKITVTFGESIVPNQNDGKQSVKSARKLTQKIKEQISAQLEAKHCQ